MKDRFKHLMKIVRACDRRPCVLVCDIDSAGMLLECRDNEDVLLFDEPTANMGADVKRAMKSVLSSLPRRTVFMSATMPERDELDRIIQTVVHRHGNPLVRQLYAHRVGMSVTARDPQGRIYCPHHFGHTPDIIKVDAHLYRFYSPAVLRELLENAPHVAQHVDLGKLLSYEGIRETCMEVLRQGGGDKEARTWSLARTAC
jgi:hypothetical protein